jgi:hypothetical protein
MINLSARTLQRKRFRRREAHEEETGELVATGAEEDIQERDLARAALTAMSELSDERRALSMSWPRCTDMWETSGWRCAVRQGVHPRENSLGEFNKSRASNISG